MGWVGGFVAKINAGVLGRIPAVWVGLFFGDVFMPCFFFRSHVLCGNVFEDVLRPVKFCELATQSV
jgi:hypothetical protein